MTSSLSQVARAKLCAEYLAERAARNPKLTPSRTYVNAATTQPYTGPGFINARPEGRDFLNILSRGLI